MALGVQQLFQHVTLWSQFPQALTHMDPLMAASLGANSRASVDSLNRFVGEMRVQEIGLLKSLQIDPDKLDAYLEKHTNFPQFFLNLKPRPEWMAVHPNMGLTIDDLQQFRMSITGAKRRLNVWGRRTTLPRPAKLVEHLHWLQESTNARVELARLAALMGEPEAGIQRFYDREARTRGRIILMEESLKYYFQVVPAAKGK